MPAPITVNEYSEFFIAICQFKDHSYVAVGVKQASGGIHLLGGFGKAQLPTGSFCRKLFSTEEAFIGNEKILVNEDAHGFPLPPGRKEIRYKAYGISYQQYLQFLAYMAAISRAQKKSLQNTPVVPQSYCLSAFVPVQQDEDIRLELKSLDELDIDNRDVNPDEFRLGYFSNSCRHTGIRLVQVARETPDLGEGVSSLFFRTPPLDALFGSGMVREGHHFYILPLPPTAFPDIKGENQKILTKLYNRLDRMMLIAQDDEISIQKFDELKSLYQVTAGIGPDGILEVIDVIENWEANHQELIAAHRSWHLFWAPTATRKMFDEFHEQFESIRKPDSFTG